MTRIFLSYRREDASGHARHLFDELADRYGKKAVFMDVTAIKGGEHFVERIDQEVGRCDVFLALIGKRWLAAKDEGGAGRLEQPDDYVRREILAALTRNITAIPVLLDGAEMPAADELPAELRELSLRNAVKLGSADWDDDLARLMQQLPTPPRRWLIRSAIAAGAAILAVALLIGLRGILWPPPEPLGGIFNVAVLDFGERESSEAKVNTSEEGRWIADRVFEGLGDLEAQVSVEESPGGVVEIGRVARTVSGRSRTEIAQSLAQLADEVNATIVVHGVLDLSRPPYLFRPSLYLTEQFNGGEELTGENAFGSPIEVVLPLDDSGRGRENRLSVAATLRSRLEALQAFTLGLAYLQIDRPDLALPRFAQAAQIEDWDSGKEVLHLFRGSALLELERLSEAAQAYGQSLELTGDEYARAHIGLGNLFFERGMLDRAAHSYRTALELGGGSPAAYVDAKAHFNLGLALAAQSRLLGEACQSEEAREILDKVHAEYERARDVEILRELAFKAGYQGGLLAQSCADGSAPADAIQGYRDAEVHFRTALALAEPRALNASGWFRRWGFGGDARVEERRWQRDRWIVWKVLGYAQLRLGELGEIESYGDAVASLETVTAQFERALGDVSPTDAAEAYRYLARALEYSDPAASELASERAEALKDSATQ